ncbi:MAG: hypothetical protein J0H51_11685 [Rhizobiales bacterium]|nr:hypothetical protein [Hyphomicrobiales bacterium]
MGLIVRFMVDQLGDPAIGAITREQLERIERMLPKIPDHLGVPRMFQSSLTARYDYARTHGWKGLERLTEARIKKMLSRLAHQILPLVGQGGIPFGARADVLIFESR